MSEAKRCDACNKLYIPRTDDDLLGRPIIVANSMIKKKRLTGISLYFNDDKIGFKDLCPDCSQKIADVFSKTNVFEKEEIVPEEPPVDEGDNEENPNIPTEPEENEGE